MKSSHRHAAKPQPRSRPRVNDRPRPKIPSSAEHPRRRFLALTVGAAAFPAMSRTAWAQIYPARPVTIIVPAAAGGATDIFARLIGEHMGGTLGQQFVIENV